MTIEVRPAEVSEILPLRKAVLRPMEPVAPSEYDAYDGAAHVGAFDGELVVGCATVIPSPYPGDDGGAGAIESAWQLRGMAVSPDRQGSGIGALVLGEALILVAATGAPALWANARSTALGFYAAMGFEIVSDEFSYGPAELPHKRILRHLRP